MYWSQATHTYLHCSFSWTAFCAEREWEQRKEREREQEACYTFTFLFHHLSLPMPRCVEVIKSIWLQQSFDAGNYCSFSPSSFFFCSQQKKLATSTLTANETLRWALWVLFKVADDDDGAGRQKVWVKASDRDGQWPGRQESHCRIFDSETLRDSLCSTSFA